jgi:uncharacterized protein (TIGR00661 family)
MGMLAVNMRIAYGVHGYGRGHAARSLAVLTVLGRRHEILVLAGAAATPLLAGFPVVQIPALTFEYRGTELSALWTLRKNASFLSSLVLGTGPVAEVEAALHRFRPDVVVSDSEPLVLRAAGRLGIPRIGFDHVGIIAWCRPSAPPPDAVQLGRDAATYRLLLGRPERVIVSSFFEAPLRRADATIVPPVLRERVIRAERCEGRHLLVYFNQPRLLTPEVLSAVAGCGLPAIVYGAGRQDRVGEIQFREIDESAFVEDLASSRAVLSTAGHQLASEALYLGKPMLVCPEECAEQRLNARELVRLGAARCVDRGALTCQGLRDFLDRLDENRAPLSRIARDGNASAMAALEARLAELGGAARAAWERVGGLDLSA